MNLDLVKRLADSMRHVPQTARDATRTMSPPLPIRVEPKSISYTARHRGTWFKPEYDFEEIQIAQDTDAYIFRSIQKKVNKVVVAGFEFVGNNPETVDYIKRRTAEISYSTNIPFEHTMWATFHDLFRFGNCMWAKVRNEEASGGDPVQINEDTIIAPVAGYFVLPMETLEFKTKVNGELKKVLQRNDSREREWSPRDIVHFYVNRKPGFLVGTPEILPALDDIALLRRIEENVEDLIETNLFPVFHYKVGTDTHPERYGPDGTKETDVVRRTIQYMPAGGIYVSDHRHVIEAIGSEGRALRIDNYLAYFKSRALAGLGTSSLDMGEGDTSNKSTASTMSKGMLMDVEAMTKIVKSFMEFYVISELLIEGGYDPLDPEESVSVKFGTIDKDERRADENQQIQLFHGNLRTVDEVRRSLGDSPWTEEHTEKTHYKMYEEPLALLRGMQPGSAASETLAQHPSSSVSPEAVSKEKKFAEQTSNKQLQPKKVQGRPTTKSKSGSARSASANKARPANQIGTRASPKTNRDLILQDHEGNEIIVTCDFEPDADRVAEWKAIVYDQYKLFGGRVSLETIADTTLWRLLE
jgi:hypothetical protein